MSTKTAANTKHLRRKKIDEAEAKELRTCHDRHDGYFRIFDS